MNRDKFQYQAEQILTNSYLTEQEIEQRIIQIADLYRFIECYDESPLEVIDCIHYHIPIIEDAGTRKAISFVGLEALTGSRSNTSLTDKHYLEDFKKNALVKELWFVYVEEGFMINFSQCPDFMKRKNIGAFYDKVFLFNFSQAVINELK